MPFQSILFERTADAATSETTEAPDFFLDLNLNQVIDAITAEKEEYKLKPFFYSSLHDPGAIQYRQEIIRDLEDSVVFDSVKWFAQQMRAVREQLAEADKLEYKWQKDSSFLDAVDIYCDAVADLVRGISAVDLKSRGFLAFRDYSNSYAESDHFTSLLGDTQKLKTDLAAVRYCVFIKGRSVTVRKPGPEIDYRAEVDQTFRRFKQRAANDYSVQFDTAIAMNHVE
ncbi:MAG TPA: DNA mismatch repair protein MutS, partial [Candidatus Binatia bacterium]